MKYDLSSRGGLEVERLLHKAHDSTSVGSNLAQRQKDFHSNSDSTGGALLSKYIYLMILIRCYYQFS